MGPGLSPGLCQLGDSVCGIRADVRLRGSVPSSCGLRAHQICVVSSLHIEKTTMRILEARRSIESMFRWGGIMYTPYTAMTMSDLCHFHEF